MGGLGSGEQHPLATAAIALDPDNHVAHAALGDMLLGKGRFGENIHCMDFVEVREEILGVRLGGDLGGGEEDLEAGYISRKGAKKDYGYGE